MDEKKLKALAAELAKGLKTEDNLNQDTSLPAFVILPGFDFPPVLYCDGISPSQTASWHPFLKSCAFPIQATSPQAVVGR